MHTESRDKAEKRDHQVLGRAKKFGEMSAKDVRLASSPVDQDVWMSLLRAWTRARLVPGSQQNTAARMRDEAGNHKKRERVSTPE